MNQPPDLRLYFDQADRMKRALRVSGVSVAETADALGVARSTVSTWLSGRKYPRRAELEKFAELTRFPVEWLELGVIPSNATEVRPEGFEPPTFWSGAQKGTESLTEVSR